MMKKTFTTTWYTNDMCLLSFVEAEDNRNGCTPTFTFEETTEKSSSFGQLLVQAVDDGLCTLGESVREAVYACLEDTFGIQKIDIPGRVDEFSDALGKIFGDGARLLEIQIMKNLYRKMGDISKHFLTKEDITFAEYVHAAELASRCR